MILRISSTWLLGHIILWCLLETSPWGSKPFSFCYLIVTLKYHSLGGSFSPGSLALKNDAKLKESGSADEKFLLITDIFFMLLSRLVFSLYLTVCRHLVKF